jgi:dienelactone hydrolase
MGATADEALSVEKGDVNGVPFLFCSVKGDEPKPLVVLCHEFTESKEMWRGHLPELATLGYFAVAVDNRAHGEREGTPFKSLALVDGKVDVCAVRRLIKETADDIPPLLDHFVAQDGIDGDRIGMVGVSMGGYATFRVLAMDSRIRVAATIIASPYWDDTPADMPVHTDPEAQQGLKSYSMKYSPAQFAERFYPRALLIQLGREDIHFNQERVVKFHRDLETLYQDAPEKLELVVHEGVRHKFIPPMWEHAKKWLQKYL